MHIYSYKAYALNYHISKQDKIKPRAHIRYLVSYDSTNIYQIWILSQEHIIQTQDVTFDNNALYMSLDLDIRAIIPKETEDLVRIIELDENHVYDKENDMLETTVIDISPIITANQKEG